MSSCELCGKPGTTKARIEGAVMVVCSSCARFGTELKAPVRAGNAPLHRTYVPQGLGSVEPDIVPDFGVRLRQARQRRGLSEVDAARELAITKTALLGYESGKHVPSDAIAKKLGKFYGITLLE